MKLIKIEDKHCNTVYIVKEQIVAIDKSGADYNIVMNGAFYTVTKKERDRIMRIITDNTIDIAMKMALNSIYGKR